MEVKELTTATTFQPYLGRQMLASSKTLFRISRVFLVTDIFTLPLHKAGIVPRDFVKVMSANMEKTSTWRY